MYNKNRLCGCRFQGISLVEVLLFIVIVGVGVAGVLAAYRISVQKSADPLVRKQVVAIAESLLEEAQLMPYTYCDPDDANATTATGAFIGPGGCASTVEQLGPESGETRYASGGLQFDNVNDYNNFNSATETPPGLKDLSGNLISSLSGYSASINITNVALSTVSALDSQRISVTVAGPGNITISLQGYKTRYAPRSTP